MEDTDFIIKDSPQIQTVARLDDLFARPFGPALNACVHRRSLTQDFNALARHLAEGMEQDIYVRHLDYDDLSALRVQLPGDAERHALDSIIKDADALLDLHQPGFARFSCRLVRANPAEPENRSGAERFHADGEAGDPYFENVLCTYAGQPTEYLAAPGKIGDFGLCNIWRFACRNSEAVAKPLIHRAPRVMAQEEPRLVLILTRSNRALWPAYDF